MYLCKLNYYWHTQARYYRVHEDQLDFLKLTKKMISGPVRTEVLQEDLRPLNKSIRQGEFKSTVSIFVRTLFEKLF